jgi:glycosyltransferase involved in cell wall biosynthesis
MLWLWWQLEPGDWVYCVRQPLADLYLDLVRLVHNRDAKLAASWMFAPRFLAPNNPEVHESYCQAVEETDAVISVSECTKGQFSSVYGYDGPVHTVRYHNLPVFEEPVPLPDGPPWRIGYMGRLSIEQKNLDTLLRSFRRLKTDGLPVELHFYGGGSDQQELEDLARGLGIDSSVAFHGRYDHRTDIPDIVADTHVFTYTSNYEGGPCFTLLELLQAGRYVVAARVGGIPDIYEGRPDIGLLVTEQNEEGISQALQHAIERVRSGAVDPRTIRRRYDKEFDMQAAHDAWLNVFREETAVAHETSAVQ